MKTSLPAALSAAFLFLPVTGFLCAQDMADSIALVVGASSPEELDESEVERLNSLMDRKLKINTASRRALLASGLFSPYQAASIIDWRSRCGDILSFTELSTLDGFDKGAVDALRPFLSLESYALPGVSSLEKGRFGQDVLLKGGWKDGNRSWGLKYRFNAGERVEGGVASRSNFADRDFPPASTSFSLAVHPRSWLSTVIVGDYYARFGEGLALWSGFSLSGVPSAGNFAKKPSGISPAVTFSSSGMLRGVAAGADFGRLSLSGGLFFPGLKPWMDEGKDLGRETGAFVNATLLSPSGRSGVTFIPGKAVSADCHYCPKGVDFFAEGAYSPSGKAVAGIGGMSVAFGGGYRLSALARGYPAGYRNRFAGAVSSGSTVSDEYGASLGLSRGSLDFTLDARCSADFGKTQIKALLKFPVLESDNWKITSRIGERLRGYGRRNRTDLRADISYVKGPFDAALRGNLLLCREAGSLVYLESGYKGEVLSCHLRGTLFRVDEWDDRIYVYERDAPGSFSVTAWYGRGASLSFYLAMKWVRPGRGWRWKLYLRGWATGYARETKKPGSAGLKLQTVINL
ncbi:MAG: hypothetical protein IJK96_05905 [Bacteroidales bacterium]|nr:hypothetical protein [Bacteroidales bacterium]